MSIGVKPFSWHDVLNIILPCVSLNVLSLLAFCLPPDAGEKVTLGITVQLSYLVCLSDVCLSRTSGLTREQTSL